jgi:hypothetical protein
MRQASLRQRERGARGGFGGGLSRVERLEPRNR